MRLDEIDAAKPQSDRQIELVRRDLAELRGRLDAIEQRLIDLEGTRDSPGSR